MHSRHRETGVGFSRDGGTVFWLSCCCFNVPGIKESVSDGETGFLVNFGDIDSMSKVLLNLACNENLLREMSKKSIMRAKNYNWEI